MNQTLASFRDLKGIGPATEARLHESGIYTWEALAVAATALASVRGEGETLRDVANGVAARRGEAGGEAAGPRLPDGERLEAFVLRIALAADGKPQRSEVTHVRTMAEQTWVGWNPDQVSAFVEKHGGLPPAEASSRPRSVASSDQVVVLDAGKAIGGVGRDINLVITNTRAVGGDFGYRATLSAHRLGSNGEGWVAVGARTGTGAAEDDVALRFPGVQLPAGIHSLQLRFELQLPRATRQPPALSLA
ncbi:hypothetical protein AB0L70_17910 [Kribbella sp. NPDC051952]|uniref:hypothetical protein n=1 Tax=Kribbella sp. NPDC051952 TaxID=3154851 RepID=UPI00342E5A61